MGSLRAGSKSAWRAQGAPALGAYLAWSLICAEVMFTAAKTKDMPSVFAKENANKVPVTALWVTNIIVQLFVVSTYFSRDAFSLMLNLTSSMALIPFLLVAGYALLMTRRGETYEANPGERIRALSACVAIRSTCSPTTMTPYCSRATSAEKSPSRTLSRTESGDRARGSPYPPPLGP
jgi:amino acid transporter